MNDRDYVRSVDRDNVDDPVGRLEDLPQRESFSTWHQSPGFGEVGDLLAPSRYAIDQLIRVCG